MKTTEENAFSLRQRQLNKTWRFTQKLRYYLWNFGWLLLACAILGIATLLLSAANYGMEVFGGFFETPMIVAVNILLPLAFCLLFYLLSGRMWLAYTITAVLSLGVAIGNYFLIAIRNDPLQFIDILCLKEALNITATQHYELHIGWELIVSVLACAGCGVVLALLARWTPKVKSRLALLIGTVLLLGGTVFVLRSGRINKAMKNYKHINSWSSTQVYISRGVLYSFTKSALSAINSAPNGYEEQKAAAILEQYPQTDIPADKKVNVICVMRESYCDLSTLKSKAGAIDFSCYDAYHALQAESLTGTLVTNGFGGNTKNAERCFLTGSYAPKEYRKPANSYVWYLREQGYTTEGAHPFNGWFYNRANINRYLGFENYSFREEVFEDLVGPDVIADDDVLYEEILRMLNASDPEKPYFSFSVTYEGHGPYNYRTNKYGTHFVKEKVGTEDGFAMENYLGCVYKRDQELMSFVDALRTSERPVVLLVYGDHKPTLGADINNYTTAAYETFGIDMDVSSEEGFVSYYGAEYLIWANDAAKEQYGLSLAGRKGPMISPCFLMNVLFDALNWDCGSSYLQAMDSYLEQFPVCSTKGRVSVDGKLVSEISGDARSSYNEMLYIDYYWKQQNKEINE